MSKNDAHDPDTLICKYELPEWNRHCINDWKMHDLIDWLTDWKFCK